MLFDELERWDGRAVPSAWACSEVEAFRGSRIAPDDRTPRIERRVTSRSPLYLGPQAPEAVDQPRDDKRAGDDTEDDERDARGGHGCRS
jgi:hypothetical protein